MGHFADRDSENSGIERCFRPENHKTRLVARAADLERQSMKRLLADGRFMHVAINVGPGVAQVRDIEWLVLVHGMLPSAANSVSHGITRRPSSNSEQERMIVRLS